MKADNGLTKAAHKSPPDLIAGVDTVDELYAIDLSSLCTFRTEGVIGKPQPTARLLKKQTRRSK